MIASGSLRPLSKPVRGVAAAVGLLLAFGVASPGAAEDASRGPVVATSSGPVQGRVTDGIHAFKGLRYGAPPTGENRFKAPRPAHLPTPPPSSRSSSPPSSPPRPR